MSNGCSTIDISNAPPIEVMEQNIPVLYRRYAPREGSGGAGLHRGGFWLDYEIELLRGQVRASFVRDHGRSGPRRPWAVRMVPSTGSRRRAAAAMATPPSATPL